MSEAEIQSGVAETAAASETGSPPSASETPAGAVSTAPDAAIRDRVDAQGTALERAYKAAEARVGAGRKTESSSERAEQAGATGADSTPKDAADSVGDSPEAGTSAAAEAPETGTEDAPVSTPEAPANWPAERREAFQKLPPEAQSVVQGFVQDLQAGYTKAAQTVAEIKSSFPALSKAVEETGAAPDRVLEYARAGVLFERDPKAALQHLAQQAGVPVWFEPPAADDAVPEFETVADMVAWTRDHTAKQVQQALRAEQERAAQERKQTEARAYLERELAEAAQVPGFDAKRAQVLEAVQASNGYLSPRQAFDLLSIETLRSEAQQAKALRAEVAALKKAEEQRKKALTAPLGRPDAAEHRRVPDGVDPIEAAFDRAAARLGQARAI